MHRVVSFAPSKIPQTHHLEPNLFQNENFDVGRDRRDTDVSKKRNRIAKI